MKKKLFHIAYIFIETFKFNIEYMHVKKTLIYSIRITDISYKKSLIYQKKNCFPRYLNLKGEPELTDP